MQYGKEVKRLICHNSASAKLRTDFSDTLVGGRFDIAGDMINFLETLTDTSRIDRLLVSNHSPALVSRIFIGLITESALWAWE